MRHRSDALRRIIKPFLVLVLPGLLICYGLMGGLGIHASSNTTKRKVQTATKAPAPRTQGSKAHPDGDRLDAVTAARVAEIQRRLKQFEAAFNPSGGSSRQDVMLDENQMAEYRDLLNELDSYPKKFKPALPRTAGGSDPNDIQAGAERLVDPSIEHIGKDYYTIACPPQPIPSTLGVLGGTFKFTGLASQRLFRNGVMSVCGTPRVQPAPIAGTFAYDDFVFSNPTANPVCITIKLKVLEQTASDYMVGAFAPTFNPANLTQGWLGDPGASSGIPPEITSFSVNVPASSPFHVMVENTNATGNGGAYQLLVCGVPNCPPCCTLSLTCPANISTTVATPDICSKVVTYTTPTPTGTCPGVTTACVPPSGASFPVGTTTVTCTATDGGFNTKDCTFTVTVQQRLVLADDGNGNCLVVTRNSCGSGAATYCWKRPDNSTVSGPCTMTVQGGTTVNILSTGADPNLLQAGASLSTRRGNGRLTVPRTPVGPTLQLVDTNIDNSTCTCP